MGNAEVDALVTYKPEHVSNAPLVFNTEIYKPAQISIHITSFEKPTASWTLSSEENLQVGLLSVKETQKDMFVIEGKIVPSAHHPDSGKYGISVRNKVGSVHANITLDYTGESLTTTDSHKETIVCSSMYPLNLSEVNNEAIDSAKDTLTVEYLLCGLTLLVALMSAGATWQYKAFSKGTTTFQTEIQIRNGTALHNVRCSTSSDDIYEEICNENAGACLPSVSGQKGEGEIDDESFKTATDPISAPYINVYEDLDDVATDSNQNMSEHYKTISCEMPMPIIDHDSDQEKEGKPCDSDAYKLII